MANSLKASTAAVIYPAPRTYNRCLADPLTRPIRLVDVSTASVGARIKKNFINGKVKELTDPATPEREAVTFYTLNHLFSMIRQQKGFHPDKRMTNGMIELSDMYFEKGRMIAVRAFYYLTLIVNREMRHGSHAKHSKVSSAFGQELGSYYSTLAGTGSPENTFTSNALTTGFGRWCEMIEWGFTNLGFSGGYGGKPWANITKCLRGYVDGQYSAEIMVDTVWTLSHNNGPIFNKGMLYKMYTQKNLIRILDVQRAGRLPNLVMNEDTVLEGHGYVDPDVRAAITLAMNEFQCEFPPVDWQEIVSLGAVGTYQNEIKKTSGVVKKTPVEKKEWDGGEQFFVMPALNVIKYEKKRTVA